MNINSKFKNCKDPPACHKFKIILHSIKKKIYLKLIHYSQFNKINSKLP